MRKESLKRSFDFLFVFVIKTDLSLDVIPQNRDLGLVLFSITFHCGVERLSEIIFRSAFEQKSAAADDQFQNEDGDEKTGELNGFSLLKLFKVEEETYRVCHAGIFLERAAASEEGNEKYHNTDDYQQIREIYEFGVEETAVFMVVGFYCEAEEGDYYSGDLEE